jgi:Uma2 family endonuclease
MTPQATLSVLEDDIRMYPNHEEDDVPEGTLHNRWSGYLVYSLAARFPDWFVAGNICVYWEPGNTRDYLAPDAFVAGGRVPEPPPRVYRTWLLPPLLFAAEIGSVSNTRDKIAEKRGRYEQHVRPLEILETEPLDEEAGEVLMPEKLHLYRLTDQGYQKVEREPNGRVRTAGLDLEIGVDEHANLRLYTLSGEPLRTYEEEQQARLAAEQRLEQEARERTAAEQRWEQEARERAAAEERAMEERTQREALEREVAELRARLAREGS